LAASSAERATVPAHRGAGWLVVLVRIDMRSPSRAAPPSADGGSARRTRLRRNFGDCCKGVILCKNKNLLKKKNEKVKFEETKFSSSTLTCGFFSDGHIAYVMKSQEDQKNSQLQDEEGKKKKTPTNKTHKKKKKKKKKKKNLVAVALMTEASKRDTPPPAPRDPAHPISFLPGYALPGLVPGGLQVRPGCDAARVDKLPRPASSDVAEADTGGKRGTASAKGSAGSGGGGGGGSSGKQRGGSGGSGKKKGKGSSSAVDTDKLPPADTDLDYENGGEDNGQLGENENIPQSSWPGAAAPSQLLPDPTVGFRGVKHLPSRTLDAWDCLWELVTTELSVDPADLVADPLLDGEDDRRGPSAAILDEFGIPLRIVPLDLDWTSHAEADAARATATARRGARRQKWRDVDSLQRACARVFRSLRLRGRKVSAVSRDFAERLAGLEQLSLVGNLLGRSDCGNGCGNGSYDGDDGAGMTDEDEPPFVHIPASLLALDLGANDLAACPVIETVAASNAATNSATTTTTTSTSTTAAPPLMHLGLEHNRVRSVHGGVVASLRATDAGARIAAGLLSLDLAHNGLSDPAETVESLAAAFPNLRVLRLEGNPLALVHGYRAFVVDRLEALEELDGVEITDKERDGYRQPAHAAAAVAAADSAANAAANAAAAPPGGKSSSSKSGKSGKGGSKASSSKTKAGSKLSSEDVDTRDSAAPLTPTRPAEPEQCIYVTVQIPALLLPPAPPRYYPMPDEAHALGLEPTEVEDVRVCVEYELAGAAVRTRYAEVDEAQTSPQRSANPG
jgi:uncharacterized membrane protein YgcG